MSRKLTAVLALSGLITAGAAGVEASAAETELPVYGVKSAGLDDRQTAALQRAFALKDVDRSEYGAVAFADEDRYLHVPSVDRGEGKPGEDGPTVQTAIDVDGLRRLKAIPAEEATKRVQEALRGAGLLPSNATPTARNTTFELVDANGRASLSAPLDTAVSYSFSLDGIPLEGAGAKLRVAYDGQGQVTGLSHSTRELSKTGSVPVYDLDRGRERCAKVFGDGVRPGKVSYVYVAPPLEEKVDRLLPSFRCEGVTADGSQAQAITVPAAVGSTLPAPDPGQPPRDTSAKISPLVESGEVGSEGTGNCSGLPNTSANIDSFNNEATGHGVPVQFSWKDANAWESDFKDPVFPGGDDSHYADDVDLTYWQGHGSPTGFYFTGCSNHNDTKLANTDARWGNLDVEWMSLFTCQILQDTSGGLTWAQRWAQAFRGLHQINSFTTVSYNSSNHGGKYAHYMLRSPFLWWNNPMKVRDAWAQASIDTQPAAVIWATMGPVSNGNLANFNDYFHGKGAVSADVISSGVYWRISGAS
ncbi:hypothetical protein FKR81_25060 [Lentzea tibetensis]|uniref:Uncharacterized protein n=1 Tax=Lentzea tibetensis TaxID=2591470 RepID=A0A563EPP5_9PSEU|nr:DUF6345 domain-containing protein [Lentzea tibetensis]TWP49373.1 hypothetical protein FKR81_25060 [Lentzea tibetensis]